MKTNYVLRLLLFLLVFIQSCQKDSSLHENTSQSDKLLERSKKYYSGQLRVRRSADSNDINIKLYQPDWSKVAYTKTKQGYDLLSIPLKSDESEHVELNIAAKETNIYGLIKRYIQGKVYFYSGSGRLKGSGVYDSEQKNFKLNEAPTFSTMDFDGGELDEVVIPGDGGGNGGGDIDWPLDPVNPNPTNPDPTNPDPSDPTSGGGSSNAPPIPADLSSASFKFVNVSSTYKQTGVKNLRIKVKDFQRNIFRKIELPVYIIGVRGSMNDADAAGFVASTINNVTDLIWALYRTSSTLPNDPIIIADFERLMRGALTLEGGTLQRNGPQVDPRVIINDAVYTLF